MSVKLYPKIKIYPIKIKQLCRVAIKWIVTGNQQQNNWNSSTIYYQLNQCLVFVSDRCSLKKVIEIWNSKKNARRKFLWLHKKGKEGKKEKNGGISVKVICSRRRASGSSSSADPSLNNSVWLLDPDGQYPLHPPSPLHLFIISFFRE